MKDFPGHRLHCLTRDLCDWTHAQQAEAFCSAGARWIQFRMKGAKLDFWEKAAIEVGEVCRRHGATFIVNDSIEVARFAEADGVHLGSCDALPGEAREQLGPDAIVGATIHDQLELATAVSEGVANYYGLGPFRSSPTKGNFLPALDPAEMDLMIELAGKIPVILIGGITRFDVPGLIDRGAYGVAACSQLFSGGALEENTKAMLAACARAVEKAA
tara:strand:- start:456 stop:1103 length:648 start_codon:yes stop_codon:yes gene_type:complete